jgi:hypothetical protein
MGLFSQKPRKPLVCPVCRSEVVTGPSSRTGFAHFATHLEDVRGPGGLLQLACGCPDAVFDPSGGKLSQDVMSHLSDKHHLKVPVT